MILFDLDGTLLPMDQNTFVKAYFGGLAKRLAPYGYDSEKLIAAEDVQSSAILVALDKMKTVISSRLVIISAVVFICLLIAYIIFTSRKHKRNMTRTISYQNRR